jgi:hypothetical protein
MIAVEPAQHLVTRGAERKAGCGEEREGLARYLLRRAHLAMRIMNIAHVVSHYTN